MRYIPISDCPPNTEIWYSWDSTRSKLTARVEPSPAQDGKLYTRIDAAITQDKDWPTIQSATRRAGWRLKRSCGVSFTSWIVFELVPVKKIASNCNHPESPDS